MELKECTYGKLVRHPGRSDIGMIVSITNNVTHANEHTREKRENAVPLVQWSCGKTCGVHYHNIEPL